jgi:hypothetical protein
MSDKKNNIFLYSPGGYGPNSRIYFWADHIEPENNQDDNDEWFEAACDYTNEQDVDYGCFFMSRNDAEQLLEALKKLLEE